jgi:hypothetical protein
MTRLEPFENRTPTWAPSVPRTRSVTLRIQATRLRRSLVGALTFCFI